MDVFFSEIFLIQNFQKYPIETSLKKYSIENTLKTLTYRMNSGPRLLTSTNLEGKNMVDIFLEKVTKILIESTSLIKSNPNECEGYVNHPVIF